MNAATNAAGGQALDAAANPSANPTMSPAADPAIGPVPPKALDGSRQRADPLADATITRLLGASPSAPDWATIGIVNRLLAQWQTNGALADWRAGDKVPPRIAAALEDYLREALSTPPDQPSPGLPAWADPVKIERAETLFYEYGMLSCILLFCSSLPECYVIPDLSAVLHIAGQLEAHTEYRIRATAGMIFPVMMKGGLATPDGSGVAQVLKVRLIHATIRHLILRGDPSQADLAGALAPLATATPPASMQEAMFAHGWNTCADGLPCNQEELAYTLLTFGYVFLRGMRTLGLGLRADDELAYLHAWNVMGHVLGIERALMADSMGEAEALFARIQARGRAQPYAPDRRPGLGRALMQAMSSEIPVRALAPFPVLMTRYLCGKATAKDIGIDERVWWLPRTLFALGMLATRGIDMVGRCFDDEFSIARLITRIVGYPFTVKVLMDQARPLKLPPAVLDQVGALTAHWHHDSKASNWVNAIERRLTGRKGAPA